MPLALLNLRSRCGSTGALGQVSGSLLFVGHLLCNCSESRVASSTFLAEFTSQPMLEEGAEAFLSDRGRLCRKCSFVL